MDHCAAFKCLAATASLAGFLASSAGAGMIEGASAAHGGGTVVSFGEVAEDGTPRVMGVRFSEGALDGLPDRPNLTSRCFDLDGNGEVGAGECEGDYEVRLAMPQEMLERGDMPFGWAMINWNPEGHEPAPWKLGHFDLHFYMMPEAELDQIAVGSCGIFVECDAFERGRVPVPARYMHPDHVSVDAVVGQMGNHLIDTKTPELADPGNTFTHTWIFGAYDGQVTFYEVMLTRAYMMLAGSGCYPIKQPEAWQRAGWYPTNYCIRYDPETKAHTVSMEDFVLREAS